MACLAPVSGERLLHLGSGTGRAVLAWALFLPQSAACGVEGSPELHQAGCRAAGCAAEEVRSRVFLHCGDIFNSQEEWHHGGVVMINSGSLADAELERVADGLQRVEPGTRIVSISRPLCANPDRAPPGFSLERRSLYRTVGGCNTTVFFYRKPAPE